MNLIDLLRQNGQNSNIDINAVMGGLVADPNRDSTGALINPEPTPRQVDIKDIQLDNNGNIMSEEQRAYEQQKNAPLTLHEKLFGRTVETPAQEEEITITDDKGNEQKIKTKVAGLEQVNNGWLNDFGNGYRDNYLNGFKVSNWNNDGRAKNIAERLGEGLGTALRWVDSPAGRTLITTGIGLANGVSPAESYGYGLRAGNLHQKLETEDNAYRQLLESQGLDTSKLNGNGWIDKDLAQTYSLNNYRMKNLQTRRDIAQAKDNTTRAGLILRGHANGEFSDEDTLTLIREYGINADDIRKSNATRNADINEYLAPHRANAYDTGAMASMGNLNIRQEMLPYQIEETIANTMQKRNGVAGNMASIQAVTDQINRFTNTFEDVAKGKGGALVSYGRTNAGLGSPEEVNFNAQRTLLFNKIARDLGGEKGVLSDQDMKRIELALPTLGDSYNQKQAKMKAIYGLINDKIKQHNAVNGTNGTSTPAPRQGTTKSGIKYTIK